MCNIEGASDTKLNLDYLVASKMLVFSLPKALITYVLFDTYM